MAVCVLCEAEEEGKGWHKLSKFGSNVLNAGNEDDYKAWWIAEHPDWPWRIVLKTSQKQITLQPHAPAKTSKG